MPDSQQTPWSDYPNAPKISHHLYIQEKVYFAGVVIGPILYGILVVLFCCCMTALFNPACHRGKGIKWGLASYTVIMFLVATVESVITFNSKSDAYINNRELSDVGAALPPGPLGYQSSLFSDVPTIVSNSMFFLNGWLADGLLLYRCYIIYSMNLWVVALPCFIYLGTLGTYQSFHKPAGKFRANAINTVTGITFQATTRSKDASYGTVISDFALPYLSISVSLNVLLTLMIAIRLVLYTRNIRTAVGIAGIGGLSKAIATMLIESCALYTMGSLLVIVPWIAGYTSVVTFVPFLSQIQVIAPLLIIQRVANKSALTKNTVVSGRLSSFKTRTRGEITGSGGTLPSGDP